MRFHSTAILTSAGELSLYFYILHFFFLAGGVSHTGLCFYYVVSWEGFCWTAELVCVCYAVFCVQFNRYLAIDWHRVSDTVLLTSLKMNKTFWSLHCSFVVISLRKPKIKKKKKKTLSMELLEYKSCTKYGKDKYLLTFFIFFLQYFSNENLPNFQTIPRSLWTF